MLPHDLMTEEERVEPIERYAEAHLRLMPQHLNRRVLYLHNRPQVGMVGCVEYRFAQPEDSAWARAINLLADLAFYTGLGRKTAQGMGMVRRILLELVGESA